MRGFPERVTIERTEGQLGVAAHLDGDLDSEDGVRAMIINCYAGREAEIRIGGPGTGSGVVINARGHRALRFKKRSTERK